MRTLHFLPTFRQLEADALLAEQEDRSHVRAAALDPPFDRPERLSDLASVAPPQVTPLHALWRLLDQHYLKPLFGGRVSRAGGRLTLSTGVLTEVFITDDD